MYFVQGSDKSNPQPPPYHDTSTMISVDITSLTHCQDLGNNLISEDLSIILGYFQPQESSTLISVAICSSSFDENLGFITFGQTRELIQDSFQPKNRTHLNISDYM